MGDILTFIEANFFSNTVLKFQAVTDVVKYKLSFAEVEQGRPATVKDAAMSFKDITYEYRDSLMAGLIVAGKDSSCFLSGNKVF